MPIIILIPAIVCVIALFRRPVYQVFLGVYLPIILLFPIFYFWKAPNLPGIDISEAVLLPLGIAILVKELPRWRFTTVDLWLALFIYSAYHADALADRHVVSIFDLFHTLLTALVPYMMGKLLIEQNSIRIATVRRFVFLLFIACLISTYEYRLGQNPFMFVWGRFFPGEKFAWKTQIRWGFGRVSGPFGQSELAGIVLLAGLVLALWLGYCHYWEPKFSNWRHTRQFNHRLRKSSIIAWTIGLTLLMTQARGPWLGCVFAVPVALVGRSRHILRNTVLVFVFLVFGGGLAFVGLKHYVSGNDPSSAEQETAQYREHLIENYLPVARQGGAWGYGQAFPHRAGQGSIDNEYLYVTLTQGWVGLVTFCLIAVESLLRLAWAAAYSPTRGDRYFNFSLIGILIGLLVTIFTVYLGLQPYQLFFLFAGWAQALQPRRAEEQVPTFQRVYT